MAGSQVGAWKCRPAQGWEEGGVWGEAHRWTGAGRLVL